MMTEKQKQRVLVLGGGTFLGLNIAAALLSEGAEVSLIIRAGNEGRLGPLANRVRWHVADVWDPASLRGRARGNDIVIHTVGSMIADPARGLTFHRLNVVSARNAANMCIGDGVPHMVLMSTVRAPWINRHYIRAKRDAEHYLERVGLQSTIIRAPLAFVPGEGRPIFYRLLSGIGSVPPLSWTRLGAVAPLPMDILTRGIARATLDQNRTRRILYARDLRRYGRSNPDDVTLIDATPIDTAAVEAENPYELLDEDTPFGWIPTTRDKELE